MSQFKRLMLGAHRVLAPAGIIRVEANRCRGPEPALAGGCVGFGPADEKGYPRIDESPILRG
jgi:hypothetical protein